MVYYTLFIGIFVIIHYLAALLTKLLEFMHTQTILALNKLNEQFYRQVGKSFSQTRQAPWQGWIQLIEQFGTQWKTTNDLKILDVGAGNGRFCTFMYESVGNNFTYLGLDADALLLQHAKAVIEKLSVSGSVSQFDFIQALLSETPAKLLPTDSFTIVSCFGVFHHLPSQQLRRKALQELAKLVAEKGFLLISLWRFAEFKRYTEKSIRPDVFKIDSTQLEQGDYLLGWDTAPVARYCHSFSQEDIDDLKQATQTLQVVAQFNADSKEGSANTYLVFQKNSQ